MGAHAGKKQAHIQDESSWAAPATWGEGRQRARALRVGGECSYSHHHPRPLIVLTNWVPLEMRNPCSRDEDISEEVVSNSAFLSPFCFVSVRPSTVTLNSRNEVVKDDECKTPQLVENKIPEGDLLLQVSLSCVI